MITSFFLRISSELENRMFSYETGVQSESLHSSEELIAWKISSRGECKVTREGEEKWGGF